uniref:Uncharacterized protein n=1 Tax=Fagus sylvatica TaxID=28930 RepID=A0A2N9I0G5_FAGSY
MRTRRGKGSEAFWPSIVMKKWLNIKPTVYDFSEDEIDTETESEDDASSPKDASVRVFEGHAHRTQWNQSICPSQTSGNTLISVLVIGPIRMKLLSQILFCA